VHGLADLRIVDVTTGIAGPYATKLLADLGAEVVKVEPDAGDPMRAWSASGSGPVEGTEASALFHFLNTSKRSVTGCSDADLDGLLDGADALVEDGTLDVDDLRGRHPHLAIISITPFGRTGPLAGRAWTEFTVQAESGSLLYRGMPGMPPYQAGGRSSEWTTGSYAGAAALAAVVQARRTGVGVHVDCSMIEVMAIAASTFADTMHSMSGRPDLDGTIARAPETPSIETAADGWIGFNTNSGAMFESFLILIERPDLIGDEELASLVGRVARVDEWTKIVRAWTSEHTVADILERAGELRVPCAQVHNGKTVLDDEHLSARSVFVDNPAGFRQPRPASRFDDAPAPPFRPAPALGEASGAIDPHDRTPRGDDRASLPFEGVRILDVTSWWAGPSGTGIMAALGAEVLHVESTGHPDGMRMTGYLFGQAEWWEWGHMFLAANTNKLGVTLDVTTPRGRELVLELVEHCDAVVDNFSPRVVESWDLGWNVIHERNPRAVMLRMPAFGLSGPWRDRVGFAQTMEQMCGMAWMTGFADDQPRIVRGPCDPIAGMHGAVALMTALEEARRTGEGILVESTMIEAALNCSAEQVVEYTAYGQVLERAGNRSPYAAPQGLYPCPGWEQYLALSVATDEQWQGLVRALGEPEWARDPALATHAGRRTAHDELDAHLAEWAAEHDVDAAVAVLVANGVPAALAWDPRVQSRHPQLVARGLYEEVDHDAVGVHTVPGLPFRWTTTDRPADTPWVRTPTPMLGQHTRAVLERLCGLDAAQLDALEADGVIGTRPTGF
jgi:crotonobetainyl-CoA:carnitine CoA-transferase CaiB-like acyl-CoA transferase